jgi:enoyl-CoA hydratase/carnithine racemase
MESIGSGLAALDHEGHRADVYLDRPAKRNAMNRALIADLTQAIRRVDADEDVRAVTILGRGEVLSAGMDLGMMRASDRATHREIHAELRGLFDAIDDLSKPSVVGIKRAAPAGAFELTLPADFRILGEDATYGVIEVELGIFPHGGTTQRLPRLVGLAKAKEMVLTGEFIDPEEADRINLVTEVRPDDAVDERAREFAGDLCEKAPLGTQRALAALDKAFDVALDAGLDVEQYLVEDLYATRDREEGFAARMEGRDPEFEGR